MALTKYKIGELIELVLDTNSDLCYQPKDVRGMTITKDIIPTKADLKGTDLSRFFVVHPGEFIYNPRTHGKKIGLGYNNTNKNFIISWNNIAFKIKKTIQEIVLSDYLFLNFKRDEWDREACYQSWGTSTEVFSWDSFCDMEIELPPISIQQKYVDVYNAMLENQKNYERGLDDLKLVCDAYIENLRRQIPCEPIGNYVHPYNVKNIEGKIILEQGINIEKKFITPHRTNDNFYGRKIVRKGHIAYCSQLNNENIAIALRTGPDCIVSNVYEVIEFNENCNLIPNYLMLWLVRSEFGRFVYWASQGTSYEFLTYENLANYCIPIPNVDIQKSIAKIYEVYLKRKEINEKLKSQLKDICPILIKGSIEEGRRMKEA
ncbi:restriction endonuclease subunit S [Parvimonas sp. G1967]|uniref:restriction endonuclease subunit S n=1 Tax=Parvimonas sp. G1967 TaxID=3387695 RepID=UPI0039E6D3A5